MNAKQESIKIEFIQEVKNTFPIVKEELQFAKKYGRRYRADIAIFVNEKIICVEFEGGIWSKGRHTTPTGYINDMIKYNLYALLDIKLIRFSIEMLTKKSLCLEILKAATEPSKEHNTTILEMYERFHIKAKKKKQIKGEQVNDHQEKEYFY